MTDEEYPKEEIERRARATAHRMLNTPPQPRRKSADATTESPGYKLGRQQPGPLKGPAPASPNQESAGKLARRPRPR
jgi:hypothetical protein